jgi:four helix bundle protein
VNTRATAPSSKGQVERVASAGNAERHGDDLRRRTKAFGGAVVRFFVGLDRGREELRILGRQLLRSGTSVGAQYREASRARSDGEFVSKIESCIQEADETQYWLEILHEDCGIAAALIDPLWKESDELISIFVTMAKNTKHSRE